jgi:hypothetical protein
MPRLFLTSSVRLSPWCPKFPVLPGAPRTPPPIASRLNLTKLEATKPRDCRMATVIDTVHSHGRRTASRVTPYETEVIDDHKTPGGLNAPITPARHCKTFWEGGENCPPVGNSLGLSVSLKGIFGAFRSYIVLAFDTGSVLPRHRPLWDKGASGLDG